MDSVFTQIGYALLLAFRDAVTFPWWWYTTGVRGLLRWGARTLRGWEHAVGLRLWARNLFVPMFGQTDWQGRIISFFMRLVMLMGRGIQVVVGACLVAIAILGYLALPLVAVLLVIRGIR